MDKALVQASVITIGDELMIGQVVDTNSPWIASELNREGIWVRKRIAVGDSREEIIRVLDEELQHSNLILITGGLGPTADDITKPLLCEYFGGRLETDPDVLQHVRHLFENVFKRPFTDLNRKQAEVPTSCKVIFNQRGTAPGMLFERDGRIIISMPGVPFEMKGMMTDEVLPIIRKRFDSGHILHKTLLTAGIGESALAEHIAAFESALPEFVKLAYLPNFGMVRLRLTATGSDLPQLEQTTEILFSALQERVKEWLVVAGDLTMVQLVSRLLKERGLSLCTAESCTGGNIAHLITGEPGSSAIFKGGFVSYANEVKTSLLHVDNLILEQYGAVSEQVVKAMIQGALKHVDASVAVATSGVMGPGGGTEQKPVGTVWLAAGTADRIITRQLKLRFDRARNIEMASVQALNLLREFLSQPPVAKSD